MIHATKERIKSIILITLFVISLIQVGILWSKQSHRLPISFLAGIFNKPVMDVSDEMTRNELFIPYRLVVSNGDDAHWVVGREDPLHKALWDEAKAYLADIADGNIAEISSDMDNWGEVTSKRGFTAEFKTGAAGINSDLIKWFLNKLNSSEDIPSVNKLMLIPETGSIPGTNTMYIYESTGRVHRYAARRYTLQKGFADILKPFEDPEIGRASCRERV